MSATSRMAEGIDHTTSHRQPWNTWKPCDRKLLKIKWNGIKSTRNNPKSLEKSSPDA